MADNRNYYVTADRHPRIPGKCFAVVSLGSPQRGDKVVTVLSVSPLFDSQGDAHMWGRAEVQRLVKEEQAMLAAAMTPAPANEG